MSRILFTLTVVLTAGLLLLSALPGVVVKAANNSEQVVFSGTGTGTFTPPGGSPTPSPFGFWVWCEADSNNPYVGRCAGAMYVYALGLVRGVQGTITEPSEGAYVMSVASQDGAISCALSNTPPATKGPTNTVTATCAAPAGSGSSSNSVVNVTGP